MFLAFFAGFRFFLIVFQMAVVPIVLKFVSPHTMLVMAVVVFEVVSELMRHYAELFHSADCAPLPPFPLRASD